MRLAACILGAPGCGNYEVTLSDGEQLVGSREVAGGNSAAADLTDIVNLYDKLLPEALTPTP